MILVTLFVQILWSYYYVSAIHHVISVTAFIGSDSSICVECLFVNGSDAIGCEVEFRDRITDECELCIRYTIYRIYISSSAFKCISHTSEGNFSVVAYDKIGNETSWLRAAVYDELPEYFLVQVDVSFSSSSPMLNSSTTPIKGKLNAIRF